MKISIFLITLITCICSYSEAGVTHKLQHRHAQNSGTSKLTSIKKGGDASSTMMSLSASMIKAVDEDQAGTNRVNQDGHDIAYFLQMTLGGQNFSLVVDTGSYYTWVYGNNCTSNACTSHSQYDPSKSKDSKHIDSDFDIKYTSGDIKGEFYRDQAKFAGFDAQLEFGVADDAGDVFESFPIDGILGMSAKDKTDDNPGVLEMLKNQKLIDKKLFGVNLGRSADPKDEGSITFGGTDTSKYTGDISWNDVIDSNSLLWIIPMDAIYKGDSKMGFDKRDAIIDTGSTLITIPPDDAEKFHSYFKGSVGDHQGNYVIPCNSSVDLNIQFNGKNWTIPPSDYMGSPVNDNKEMCSTLIRGMSITGNAPNQWLIGDVFLKNVYSVFDVDNLKVGFANKTAGPTNPTPQDTLRANNNAKANETSDGSATSTGSSAASKASSTKSTSKSHENSASSTRFAGVCQCVMIMTLTVMFLY